VTDREEPGGNEKIINRLIENGLLKNMPVPLDAALFRFGFTAKQKGSL
jgi:hypothetical protein